MRLTTILLLTAALHVAANTEGQNVTLNVKDAPVREVFREIQKQTGLNVMMDESLIKKMHVITLNVQNRPVSEVLNICFQNESLDYKIGDGRITVKTKQQSYEIGVDSSLLISPPIDIHGRVTDSLGKPLVNASVIVKGKGRVKGTETDANGNFTLYGVNDNATIVISYTGYTTKQFKISGGSDIIISLNKSTNILDQVQVIAYGTTTRRFDVGNVSTVTADVIEKQPVSNPLLALEGRVPGLFITQYSAVSGSAVNVQIQGQNSIVNGSDPFYVIDGVPYYSQLLTTGNDGILGSSGQGPLSGNGSPFSYINPADIESVSVLKDADATSIYGSRAANGAILITTKKGKAGKMRVDVNLQQGFGQITRSLKTVNTQQYLGMRREAFKNDGLPLPSIVTDPNNTDYDLNGLWDTSRFTNWQKTLIGGTANYTNVTGSISGGSSNTQYLASFSYNRQTSVFQGDFSDQKGSAHFSLNSESENKRFHFTLSGLYFFDLNELPNGDPTNASFQLSPDAPPLYTMDGNLNWAPTASGNASWINPLSYLYRIYQNKTSNLVSNAVLSYRIVEGLEIKSSFGYTKTETNDFVPYSLLALPPERRLGNFNGANYGIRDMNSWIIEPQLTFNRFIGRGKFDFLLGSTINQNNNYSQNIAGQNYISDQLLENISAASKIFVTQTASSQYKYNALFARVNYNWDDKYILDATARRDGSSRFGVANEFHNFWSLGGAWIFSQETFLKQGNWLSFGKLRLSYGKTGNDQIGDYSFLSLYYPLTPSVPYENNNGLVPAGLSNPYLQWEETSKAQIGIDLGFFKDNVLLGGTFSRNRSSNQLIGYVLPSITGAQGITRNFPATVQNIDLEFTLQTKNIKSKDFSWTTSFNLTIPQNKLIAFPNLASSSYAYNLIVGQPLGFISAFHFLGVDPATGQYEFSGKNGKPTTSPSPNGELGVSTFGDRTIIINPFPKFYGGLVNSIIYKGFELDFTFQFTDHIGQNILFAGGGNFPGQFSGGGGGGYGNQPVTVLHQWQKPGDRSSIAEYSTQYSTNNYSVYNALQSDYQYTDASYVRLKNLSLSIQLPLKWQKEAHLQSCKIYLQGQNLITITSYKGLDPENTGITTQLPPLRILTFGLQVGL